MEIQKRVEMKSASTKNIANELEKHKLKALEARAVEKVCVLTISTICHFNQLLHLFWDVMYLTGCRNAFKNKKD